LSGTRAAARALEVQLQLFPAHNPGELEGAFAAMTREHAEALISLPSPMLFVEHRRIVDLAAKSRLPAMYPTREFVEAGGLMAYGANVVELFRRAAGYVDKILKGAKPADLPVEQPTKFEFLINLKAAEALGLTIPPMLLATADEVIE
jgi:putative tryptophan/tyrosine transport system substrate-binding protein